MSKECAWPGCDADATAQIESLPARTERGERTESNPTGKYLVPAKVLHFCQEHAEKMRRQVQADLQRKQKLRAEKRLEEIDRAGYVAPDKGHAVAEETLPSGFHVKVWAAGTYFSYTLYDADGSVVVDGTIYGSAALAVEGAREYLASCDRMRRVRTEVPA
jgi:hypothetical protein